MKINFNTGIQIKNSLQDCIETKMPIKTAYKIMKIIKAIEEEEQFYNTHLKSIIEKYAEKDAEGNLIPTGENSIKIKEDQIEQCSKEMEELNSIEIELPDNKLSFEELEQIELSPKEIHFLEQIIE